MAFAHAAAVSPEVLAQYAAARAAAAVFDRPGHGVIQVSGRDRVTFLHGLISADVKTLPADAGRHAFFLNPTGHTIADMVVFNRGEAILLRPGAGTAARLAADFEKVHFTEKVTIEDVSARFAVLAVVGPRTPELLAAALTVNTAGLPPLGHVVARLAGAEIIVLSRPDLGLAGCELIVPVEAAAAARALLAEKAAGLGGATIGPEVVEILRVEAGTPVSPSEIDETVLGPELGLPESLSTTKCYPGQEVVARIASRGHVNRMLRGLRIAGSAMPATGDEVRMGERKVGAVTSAVLSPCFGPIALAILRREAAQAGTAVEAVHSGAAMAGTTSALPFSE
jgi:folate-binding protein YgfZ